ncbi:hypothetical protein [Methylotenera sp. G11]|uniref:hypothetical protein n=1 Tax=Methylotenera sp. G11 TaxID=1506585 RepID=UPI000646C02F|nr:hypothetical protein [Methylotenera sp. G11]
MELFQVALPLIGVIIGSLLTGLGTYIQAKLERKRTIALALTDLLEIRHHISGIEVIFEAMHKRFDIPAEASLILQTLIEQMSPLNNDVHKRYDNAISLLAGLDPMLAFHLRSKNTLPNLLATIRSITESAGLSKDDIVQIESTLRLSLAPHLDEAVIELAGRHSLNTKRKVKKLISNSKEMPPELDDIFNQLKNIGMLSEQSAQ